MAGMDSLGGSGGSAPAEPSCDIIADVFEPSCGDGDCHNSVGIGNFAVSEEAAAAYLGEDPTFSSGVCGLMIDPDDPERSLILTKVTGDPPYEEGDCGNRMPVSRDPLTDDQLDCLRSWLQQFQR